MIVTATGANTEMGKIAGMLSSVTAAKSPLQREVNGLTIRLAIIAWLVFAILLWVATVLSFPSTSSWKRNLPSSTDAVPNTNSVDPPPMSTTR